MDNLDIQGRQNDEREEEEETTKFVEQKILSPGPPPPPLPPPFNAKNTTNSSSGNSSTGLTSNHESETAKTPQPLAAISIQDLTSVQLRRTNIKMNATKTFSAPPPRSVSMTNGILIFICVIYYYNSLFSGLLNLFFIFVCSV